MWSRVRIEPKPGLKIDVFVTHTIADSGTTMYNNTWARIKQVEELMDSYILKSDADAVILGKWNELKIFKLRSLTKNSIYSTLKPNTLGSVNSIVDIHGLLRKV